jgi:sulfate permease, SulP family
MTQLEARGVPASMRTQLLQKVRQSGLVSAVVSGVVSGTLVVTFDISLAALLLTGALGSRLPQGIGIFLVSSVITGTIVSLGSSFRPVIAAPQHDTGVILASMAAGIAATITKLDPAADPFPTIVAGVAVSSLATGALFLVLGLLRLGILVRFIPYPVVGGFLAGAGWLAVQGSVAIMSSSNAHWEDLPTLLQPQALSKILPGLLLGVLLAALLRRFTHFLLLPALIIGSIGVFYATLSIAGMSVKQAGEMDLLLGSFPSGGLWPPMALHEVSLVNWSVLAQNIGNIAAITVMAAITLLLGASGVELATEQEIDLDRELRATGIANMVAGATGSVVSYLSMAESTMNYKAGANSRLAGLTAAAVSVMVLIFGGEALFFFPRPVLGGLVAFLGFLFLLDTVYEGWFRLRRVEYLVVIVILLVVAIWGFLLGVAVGLGISFVLFALSYSRIEVIRNAISGVHLRSNVARSDGEEMTLMERANQLYVLQLQGYIFFGTAYNLLVSAKQRIQGTEGDQIRYLLLDFRHVNGLDSSAIASFLGLRRLAKTNGVKLILTEVPTDIGNHLKRGEVVLETDDVCRIYADLDHGLEACENEIIHEAPPSMLPPPMLFYDLQDVFNGREEMIRFLNHLERVEAPADYDLFRQGDVSKDLYLIESGELTAWLERDGKKVKRLRTMGPGSVVGESGLYMGEKRSATVTASRQATLYRLSEGALRRLTAEAPELAAAFHHFVVTLLARRIVHSTGPVRSMFN